MMIGTWLDDGAPARLDLGALIAGRLAIVGNSGSGKSWAMRKILEVTAGQVQQIVLDPEDEFYTLRETSEIVLAGGSSGDVPAQVESASRAGRTLLELGCSAVMQLNDFGLDQRREFVAAFLAGVMGAPRASWHPTLIVIDEAHNFAPATGAPASAGQVKALMSQGRKRSFAGVLATQRLPRLHPDVRNECQNWLIGRVGQALDRRTACDMLGMPATGPEAVGLQAQDPGIFWAFGPALSPVPRQLRIGPVETTHIAPGRPQVPTPPPPERVRAVLASLSSAEQAPQAEDAPGGTAAPGELARVQGELREARETLANAKAQMARLKGRVERAETVLQQIAELAAARPATCADSQTDLPCSPAAATEPNGASGEAPQFSRSTAAPQATRGGGRARMLAELVAAGPRGLTRDELAIRACISAKGGTFGTYLSRMRLAGELKEEAGRLYPGPNAGSAQEVPDPSSPADRIDYWSGKIGGAGRLLRMLADVWPRSVTRAELADWADLEQTGGTFGTYLSRMRSRGLATVDGAELRATPELME